MRAPLSSLARFVLLASFGSGAAACAIDGAELRSDGAVLRPEGPPAGLLPEEARGGAAAALRGVYDALRGGDPARLGAWLEPDAIVLGTAPEELWNGRDAVLAALGARLSTRSDVYLREGRLDVRAAPGLGVAYVHDEPRLAGRTRDGVETDLPMRVTGTLVRRADGWRFALLHFAVPLPDADTTRYDRAVKR